MVAATMGSRQGLLRLVESVRPLVGDAPLLSALGIALHRQETSFSPAAYGATKLSELLRDLPEIGEIEDTGSRARFRFSGARPAVAITPSPPPRRTLREHLWRAATDFAAPVDGWKVDLATGEIDTPDHERVAAEPERYLDVPRLGADFQKDLLRRFISDLAAGELERLDAELLPADWRKRAQELLDRLGLNQRWAAYRRERIAETLQEWGRAHGLDVEARAHREAVRLNTSDSLRAFLHRAIDALDDGELRLVQLPATFCRRAQHR